MKGGAKKMNVERSKKYLFHCERKRLANPAANERGTAIVVSMLMLVLLTFLGIGAVTISSIQVRMAANDRNFKQAFYLAESAAMEAVQRIENAGQTDLRSGSISWINSQADLAGLEEAGWNGTQSSPCSVDAATRYGAVDQGVAAGSSLGMGDTSLRSYAVYGRYGGARGRCLVEVGYRKRF